jgi:prepilin signal peptidase PulO-like enzyme (type II secretory pathway)
MIPVLTPFAVSGLLGAVVGIISLPLWLRLGILSLRPWMAPEVSAPLARPGHWWLAAGLVGGLLAILMPQGMPLVICGGMLGGILIALCRLDIACRMLPDGLTMTMLISGLLLSALTDTRSVLDSLIGACAGYGLLWGLAAAFRRLRGVDAMGRGDFAMAAAMGAWLGWVGLPLALAAASICALAWALLGTAGRRLGRLSKTWRGQASTSRPDVEADSFLRQEVAFGPALVIGFLVSWSIHG